jgi:hypothetical protein
MAATSQLLANFRTHRRTHHGNVSVIPVIITATATAYATASGGLPVDLTSVLQQAAPVRTGLPESGRHRRRVLRLVLPTNGFMPGPLVLGTPTFTRRRLSLLPRTPNNKVLATCPATIRLYGSGSGARAALQEIADGNVTDTITLH